MTLFDEEIARLDVERADLAARAARETDDGRRAYVDAIVARVERARARRSPPPPPQIRVSKNRRRRDATSRACTRAISRRDVFDSNTSPRIPRS